MQDPQALCLQWIQTYWPSWSLAREASENFLARVKLTLQLLPQWILGRENSQNSLFNKPSLSSPAPSPALWWELGAQMETSILPAWSSVWQGDRCGNRGPSVIGTVGEVTLGVGATPSRVSPLTTKVLRVGALQDTGPDVPRERTTSGWPLVV